MMNDPRLFLRTSNRMEDLAAMLAEVLSRRGRDPFQPETVLVQSRGMGRWLSLQLADAQGICLNVRFPFPREVIDELVAAMLPDWQQTPTAFRRENLVWSLFRLLGEVGQEPAFSAIRQYLAGEDLLKRMQLAGRLGSLFDQYLVYRTDWLLEWERGGSPDDWQAILWRRIIEEAGEERHLAHALDRLRNDSVSQIGAPALPSRICVFGISSLPPLFLQILRHYAASGGELHLFLLQPTDSYWGDLLSKKQQARLPAGGAGFVDEGHPLVASLGRQGQDLLNLLIDADFQQPEEGQVFHAPAGSSLLEQLQADILALESRESARIPVAATDDSIQVHSCHSPMRETEVLHDQLLDLFSRSPDLRPRDVLVMIPDIEAYAPYVQAVFGAPENARSSIPFSIVDRRPRTAFHAIDAWFRLLELAGSRFAVRDVVAILETPAFRLRFKLSERDVDCLRSWIANTGIRWGIDADHRAEQGLAGVPETTWVAGIEQWLLGYAMQEDQEGQPVSFAGRFPYAEIEGNNLVLANQFLKVLHFLFATRAELSASRPLAAWCDALGSLLEGLFGEIDDLAREADAIRSALASLRRTAVQAKVGEPLPLEVIRYILEEAVDGAASGGGFLSGGVTFCTLQPMRTVPARVVCLVGMNDNAFPRRPPSVGFDRMRDERRLGDRSIREDDRYLFLETLLSVRQTLLISYVGQSARDLSEAPPSVLVSELLDHLDRACVFERATGARAALVRRHRLQSFHADYFRAESRLFSFSEENLRACLQVLRADDAETPFARGKLPEPEAEWRVVSVQQLIRCFRNPSEYFLKERLGLRFPQDEEMLEDAELFSLGDLARFGLKKDWVRQLVEKQPAAGWQRLQARGAVPLGSPGVAACHSLKREAQIFAARVAAEMGAENEGESRAIEARIGLFHVTGEIGPFFDQKLVVYRPAKVKPMDCVSAWIQHLLANVASGGNITTVLLGEDRTIELPPRPAAESHLAELLDWYWRGLQEPLPFFPDAAYEYMTKQAAGKGAEALAAAEKKFLGDPHGDQYYSRGEADNSSVKLCWGDALSSASALGETFQHLAALLLVEIERFNGKEVAR
jgi:exodeoxyribonuclease V gamma subunit